MPSLQLACPTVTSIGPNKESEGETDYACNESEIDKQANKVLGEFLQSFQAEGDSDPILTLEGPADVSLDMDAEDAGFFDSDSSCSDSDSFSKDNEHSN